MKNTKGQLCVVFFFKTLGSRIKMAELQHSSSSPCAFGTSPRK